MEEITLENEDERRRRVEEALLARDDGPLDTHIRPDTDLPALTKRKNESFDEWLERMDTLARDTYEDGLNEATDIKTRKAIADSIFEMKGKKKGKTTPEPTNQNVFVLDQNAADRLIAAATGLRGEVRDVTGSA